MTKLPVVKARECIRALERAGFVFDRQEGGHVTLIRGNPFARVTIPQHNKTLKKGSLRQIIRDAGLTVEEFVELL